MFTDQRSRRVILVAHCVLNQNARIDGCARYPGAMRELARRLVDSGLGIVQMPCPEMMCLGLDREKDPQSGATIDAEGTRVAERLNEPAGLAACERLAADVVYQVCEYRRHGFEVAGILGVNTSPSCGVETTWRDGEERPGPGAFIGALRDALAAHGISLPARGVKASHPEGAVAALRELAGQS